jgi:two-component system LytT family response regulator
VLNVYIVDDESTARKRLRRFLEDQEGIRIVGESSDGAGAIDEIKTKRPDIVFLDIQMAGLNGFDVVTALASMEKIPAYIFVTAYDTYAVRAFDIAAVDYVLKPYNKERIQKAIARARALLDKNGTREISERLTDALDQLSGTRHRLTLKTDNRMLVLSHDEIDWIEATGHQVRVHAGSKTYICRMSLSDINCQLPETTFQRIHRSYIVNLNKIREIHPMFHGDCLLVLTNQSQVFMSRTYSEKVKLLLGSK